MSDRNKAQYLPTTEQGFASICVCQMLSNYFQNVEIFRFDEQRGEIYIFVSDEIEVLVERDGHWRFV